MPDIEKYFLWIISLWKSPPEKDSRKPFLLNVLQMKLQIMFATKFEKIGYLRNNKKNGKGKKKLMFLL
jgi:hypothetical protein